VPGSLEGAPSLERAVTTTWAPYRARARAMALPMPREAPVTTQTCSRKRMGLPPCSGLAISYVAWGGLSKKGAWAAPLTFPSPGPH